MASLTPENQSPAIDRIIHDPSAASPLVYTEGHSIFPIESVCGMVEITMRLDTRKLKEDIQRMAPVKAMRTRRFLAPTPGSRTNRQCIQKDDCLSPRSFVVGLPADPNWSEEAIVGALRSVQQELGHPTHVHGLYVIGIGFF